MDTLVRAGQRSLEFTLRSCQQKCISKVLAIHIRRNRFSNVFSHTVRITTSACKWQKQSLLVDVTLTAGVAPKKHIAAIAGVTWLPAEAIYRTDFQKLW